MLLLYLTFGYTEDVCHQTRLGLQAVNDQHFGLWLNLWHVVRDQVAPHMKVSFYTDLEMC